MQQYLQNKKGLVEGVFDQVYDRYDLMNDFMSLGIHRLWKKSLINMMGPSVNKKLVDVACGTGDIGKLFLDKTDNKSKVTSIDPNKKMISQGKNKLSKYKSIEWITAPAEKLPLSDNSFDYYTISFGLRNTKNLDQALSEAYKRGNVLVSRGAKNRTVAGTCKYELATPDDCIKSGHILRQPAGNIPYGTDAQTCVTFPITAEQPKIDALT